MSISIDCCTSDTVTTVDVVESADAADAADADETVLLCPTTLGVPILPLKLLLVSSSNAYVLALTSIIAVPEAEAEAYPEAEAAAERDASIASI